MRYIAFVFLFVALTGSAQWDPNAGVIPSYTLNTKIITSSGGIGKEVNDSNDKTFWQSGSPYPYDFINRSDLNVFKNLAGSDRCQKSGASNFQTITDGDLKSNSSILIDKGKAWLQFLLSDPQSLHAVAMKCVVSLPVEVFAYSSKKDSTLIATYRSENNYKWKRYEVCLDDVMRVKLISSSQFVVHEVAALKAPPTEYVIVDLGKDQDIGWIETRHWAGGQAVGSKLLASRDRVMWKELATLNPEALFTVTTRLEQPLSIRYIKVEHALNEDDYGKAFVWEVNAYDQYGPYGPMPDPRKSSATVSEITGINGIWSWGYDKHSDQLNEGQGPTLFNKVATHARNFHNLHWDISDPDSLPDYIKMSRENGTQAKSWLNWDQEYQAWRDAGLAVHVSIKFNEKTMPGSLWDNPFKAGYHFGNAFARHFGPTNGNGLVDVLEAGNEPWDYPASFYREVSSGMIQGAKAADPQLTVLSCALQSIFPGEESETGGNFVGARLTQAEANIIDGLNVHHYSYAYNPDGKRIGVYPEHKESSVRGMINDVRFRDKNMPGKRIYVSEWGWDSDGAGESCVHSECVTEKEQALYAVRGALMFIRLGADNLTWFFYANGGGGLYSRSGLVGSKNTGYLKKKSFTAFQALRHILGDLYFLDVIREDDEAWIYKFGDEKGNATHLVAWQPVNGESMTTNSVKIALDRKPERSWKIEGLLPEGEIDKASVSYEDGKLVLKVSPVPLIVKLLVN